MVSARTIHRTAAAGAACGRSPLLLRPADVKFDCASFTAWGSNMRRGGLVAAGGQDRFQRNRLAIKASDYTAVYRQ